MAAPKAAISAALESVAAGPASQCTCTAFTACKACQGRSAITATPPLAPAGCGGKASTARTPGIAPAAAPSWLATRPPSVGHITTLA